MYFNKLKHLELSSELINNDEGFTKFNIERLEWLVSPSEVISDDIKQLLTILHKHLVSYIKERRESISIIPESLNDDKH